MSNPRDFKTLDHPDLIKLLSAGGVGVIPTDTVYGLVCCAADEAAVKNLYSLKNRENKPGTVIAASIEQLIELGIKARYLKPVQDFWPNAISIVIPSYELSHIHLNVGSIAVRIPKGNTLNALLDKVGPLLTTSANLPNKPEATNVEAAKKYFGDKVDFYVDGDDLSNRLPSTVIRIVDDAVEILRQGAVKLDESGRITK